ncbi:hypothetical protein BD289DRAFT_370027 [Coniella lustricola]|uniref:FAD/NAD(P)-binding domain-containing protein n=1 Tax=Coniella lustricola TaxID=2025994 RepID=A0A2T3A5W8_9PEZI|nr:hypothetical protein BD289DRAFT_370027 [Coniella lustricola]
MASTLRNVVVVGGSYTGVNTAKELANALPATYRVLLIDPHSHFNHLFAFPRFSILPGYEHKAFIPYTGAFSEVANASQHTRIQAKAVSLSLQPQARHLTLDREWQGSTSLAFDYLVAATGTRLVAPSNMPSDDKPDAVAYLKRFNSGIARSRSVVIIGGGAVGVQMACDLKEIYPDKEVTLVHSREHIMPVYHEKLSDIIKDRFRELGINFVGGSRVALPPAGFPLGGTGEPITVALSNGKTLTADFVVTATGQTPNTQWITNSSGSSSDALVNPANGFIRVKPTMQFADPAYPHLFAVGDIADTGAHKAARPAGPHAAVLARNMVALIEGREPTETIEVNPAAIHLTLGLTKNIIFRNPNVKEGQTEPSFNLKDDGKPDMNIEGTWVRRGVKVSGPEEYHL